MKVVYLVSAIVLQCSWSYGSPGPDGVGVFAYQDSTGRRYECVYKPNINEADDSSESSNVNKINEVLPFDTNWQCRRFLPPLPPLPPLKPLTPFKPLRPLPPMKPLPRLLSPFPTLSPFPQLPPLPHFKTLRYPPYGHFNYFGPSYRAPFDMSGSNSAFAAGAVGPGFRHQVAAINPGNPQMPNVDTTMNRAPENRQGFYSVSSSSYASSMNNNGVPQNQRGAETVVNDNGRITKYVVHN
ncbi:PREDICTED: RNA-binding protein 12-like isoform X3 [Papilio polytes]|uniref:RNA-binding protein 12-like isoform X3 n=1 Tax=Papilio polytes TaxID=76194 RepID=UPI000675D014|nr:PREDICTED: RNA-binding protein 12-like isoform X3 [Papilio polytes]